MAWFLLPIVCAIDPCGYTWYPGTTREQVRDRILKQHDAGTNVPGKIRGWYDMVGGGAGFLLIETGETGETGEINDFLMPYMDLMAWDVRALNELGYDQAIARFRQAAGR